MQHRILTALGLTLALAAPVAVTANAPTALAVSCTVNVKLTPGVSNAGVACLEQRMIELGYPGIGTPDSIYGTNTANAVKSFQNDRGLYPDGIVTSVTSRQLGLRGALPGPTAPRVTVLGDSTSAAMRWYDEANNSTLRYDKMGTGHDLLWSVESCRRLVRVSCTGRTDPGTGAKWVPVSVLPLMQTTLRGKLGQAVVIMAGYDDTSISTAIDPIMAEAKAQGVARVFWLNYRVSSSYGYGPYYAAHNANLEAAKVRWPNLTVLDWNGFTYAQSAATQTAWFAPDQIHMDPAGATALAEWLKTNVDAWHLERCKAINANTGVVAPAIGSPTVVGEPSGFVGLGPVRMLDTRDPGPGRIGAGREVEIDVNAVAPADATAISLSVTAVDPCTNGFLTVYDCDVRPFISNLNYVPGRTTAGMAISLLTDRKVCIFSSSITDLIVDVTGAFTPGGARFTPIAPTRWVDTRGNPAVLSLPTGARTAGSDTEVQIAGQGVVPADATAVWLNVVGSLANSKSFITVYPGQCGTAPLSSNVNMLAGRTAAAAVLVGLGPTGSVCVRVGGGSTHVVVDVAGWFSADPTALAYRAGPQARLYDSRPASGPPAPNPPAGTVHEVTIGSVAVLNVTSIVAGGTGFLAAKPCGVTDTSSLINNALYETMANATAIAPSANGEVCVSASMPTHVVVDQLGTFVPPGG